MSQLKNRYTFYAMANHVTAEEQRKIDCENYPHAQMTGFKNWMGEAKARFADAHPELVRQGEIMDDHALTRFIGQEVMKYLGLEPEDWAEDPITKGP